MNRFGHIGEAAFRKGENPAASPGAAAKGALLAAAGNAAEHFFVSFVRRYWRYSIKQRAAEMRLFKGWRVSGL